MKYTYNELREIHDSIETFLNNQNLSLKFELIYKLKKFKKQLEDEIRTIQDIIPKSVPEFQEYQEKLIQAYVEAGATPKQENGQVRIEFDDPNLDKEKAQRLIDELQDEYSDILDKQSEIFKEQQKVVNTKIVEISPPLLSMNLFPEKMKPNTVPDFIIGMIDEGSE